mmetsp:Transcript_14242/g.29221  ORF Transcript_14242/g.29221 Transcript_14242/m.29221 type:complete len:194 (-) Transcript_14242:370-951(-)|eukprot:CAMPEP_0171977628 /NCGR_PEP_ID=MMETSP0993-20121228/248165_1 /TAXON_ID=483369 /ORGANISM="non described non described, Strain CCMP2098" /LENGTH=193 /DNA_ID=CAMNT_0012629401 /DNA_START=556 /DNA_END=1134 /DNA_ORIENTATION=-
MAPADPPQSTEVEHLSPVSTPPTQTLTNSLAGDAKSPFSLSIVSNNEVQACGPWKSVKSRTTSAAQRTVEQLVVCVRTRSPHGVGSGVGGKVGSGEGTKEGTSDGDKVGAKLGLLGTSDGDEEGAGTGVSVGGWEGSAEAVGSGVGSSESEGGAVGSGSGSMLENCELRVPDELIDRQLECRKSPVLGDELDC